MPEDEVRLQAVDVMTAKQAVVEIFEDIYGPQNVHSTSKKRGFVVRSKTTGEKVVIQPDGGRVTIDTSNAQATVVSRIGSMESGGNAGAATGTTTETSTDRAEMGDTENLESIPSRAFPDRGMLQEETDHEVAAVMRVMHDDSIKFIPPDGGGSFFDFSYGVIVDSSGDVRLEFVADDVEITQEDVEGVCQKIRESLMEHVR